MDKVLKSTRIEAFKSKALHDVLILFWKCWLWKVIKPQFTLLILFRLGLDTKKLPIIRLHMVYLKNPTQYHLAGFGNLGIKVYGGGMTNQSI